ncbi:Trypanosomal VSG domain containing protein, putative [Trypanosoma equiperdum]|uniref:Trypanosomal VSG domain containing protein, putative n=1 Tax=Trypanosoma equiperdum TaxID=5694 RepID=A0A1G4IEM1_TRYEQ|nr:Trypanosomal VSG domain containing protein, putative [Trypanosoma equiperdum]
MSRKVVQVSIFACVLAALQHQQVRANVSAGDNAAERAALCSIIEVAGNRAKLHDQKPTFDTELQGIMELNMTAAEDSWLAEFRSPENPEQPRDTNKHPLPQNRGWDKRWQHWQRAASNLLKPASMTARRQHYKLHELSEQQRKNLRTAVARLAEEAFAEATDSETETALSDIIDENTLQKEINQEVYAMDSEPATNFESYPFNGQAQRTRKGSCGTDTVACKANNLFDALFCICAGDSANNGNAGKACRADATVGSSWNPSATPAPNAGELQAVRKLCNRQGETKPTSADLNNRIATIANLVRRGTSASHIGTFLQTDCSGAQTNGMCVTYTGVTDTTGDVRKEVPWLQKLIQTAEKLRKHEVAVRHLQAVKKSLKAKYDLAQQKEYLQLSAPAAAATGTSGAEPAKPQEKTTTAQQTCDKHKSNKTACESTANCKWKGTDEKTGSCEVDESKVTEQTNTAGGTGEGTTAEEIGSDGCCFC